MIIGYMNFNFLQNIIIAYLNLVQKDNNDDPLGVIIFYG